MNDPGTWKEKKHSGKHLKEESALPQLQLHSYSDWVLKLYIFPQVCPQPSD